MDHPWMFSHKLMNLVERIPVLRRCRGNPRWRRLHDAVLTKAVLTMPDRVFLEQQILPAVAAAEFERVLSVGCADYTRHYRSLFRDSRTEFWTIDIDPAAAEGEDPDRHVTCDVLEADRHLPVRDIDMILINGVIGYGVNSPAELGALFRTLHQLLRPSGILLVGWNRDLIDDPTDLEECRRLFDRAAPFSLPSRTSFDVQQHVLDLDFLVRKAPPGQFARRPTPVP